MRSDNMRFDCLAKDFLRLHGLVAQLPEGMMGIRNLEEGTLTASLMPFENVPLHGSLKFCGIYPTKVDGKINVGAVQLPSGSDPTYTDTKVAFSYMGDNYAIFKERPLRVHA